MLRTLFAALLLLPLSLNAQFILNGSATQLNDSCYQITPPINFSAGSMWNPDKIDLNESFDLVAQVKLGCKDFSGADGIVFVLQPISTSIGSAGGGIGFQNIAPSLGIEMDNFQNTALGDPFFDHIAILRNGDPDHNTANNLAGPVRADEARIDVEDCNFYDLRVSWDAALQLLEVYFNCQLRLSYQGDIVNTIFSGDPEVFWGFTSATGGFNNTHEVCFTYSSDLNALDDVVVCPGGSIMLEASSGLSHSWFPTAGLSNSTIANPIVTPSQTTLYTVEIIDECNRPFFEEVLVEVAGDAITFDLGPDTFVCAGQPLVLDATSADAEYAWSTGENTSQISVQQAGSYSVTVTQTTTSCVTEDAVQISARALPEVTLPEDTSLCIGQTILLQASDPMATHQWQDGSSGASFLVTTPGQYMLTSTNECGSRDASIQVVIESCREVYLPNAFSPNNDGFNDRFFPDHGDDILEVTVLQIFDRWGNLHFENTNFPAGAALAGWDGQVNGEDAATGVYVYLLECVFRDGTTAQLSGSIHLIR